MIAQNEKDKQNLRVGEVIGQTPAFRATKLSGRVGDKIGSVGVMTCEQEYAKPGASYVSMAGI